MTMLRNLATALGGEVSGDHVLAPGPGHSKRDRSMAVWIDPNAPRLIRAHSFAGDDWRECLKHAEGLLGPGAARPETVASTRSPHVVKQGDGERSDRSLDIWKQSADARNTPVETYLASRGLRLPGDDHVLRYHPACPFRLDNGERVRLPSMVALFRDITTNKATAVHRTALKADGSGKAEIACLGNPKKMLGPTRGAVIKLDPDADVLLGLAVAEGIETALTAFGADWHPIWACGSAGAISGFPVLPGVDELTIFGDADPAGITAARACQSRWTKADRLCTILLPPVDGNDWNDIARAA